MKNVYGTLLVCAGVIAACSTSATESGQTPTKPAARQGAADASANVPAKVLVPASQSEAPEAPVAVTAVPAVAPLASPGSALPPAAASLPVPTTAVAAAPVPAGAGGVVTFHIPAGTGKKAWNSAETPIPLQAGQTLEIVNDDSVQHWIHTDGAPFFHPFGGIAPGASASYKANSKFSGKLHDHLTYGMIYMGDK